MSMWSSQNTSKKLKEGEDGLENSHRNTGQDICGKHRLNHFYQLYTNKSESSFGENDPVFQQGNIVLYK